MTSNKEDYLKAIYKLGGLHKTISNKSISEALNISPASVTEMLQKLSGEGLIIYRAYKGSTLTEKGLQAVLTLVRGHRLWEVFLIRHLGYSSSEAHEDAELLEHVAPKRLIDKLDLFLNYPQTCPHGNLIPDSNNKVQELNLVLLSSLNINDEGIIKIFDENKKNLDYLEKKNININDSFKIIDLDKSKITLEINNNLKTIDSDFSSLIFVEKKEIK